MKHRLLPILALLLLLLAAIPLFAAEEAFTLEELATYNGQNGQPAYIAVEGVVYDVSNSSRWKGGRHNGFEAGNDLTEEIVGRSPHGKIVLGRLPVVGTLTEYTVVEAPQRPTGNLYAILGLISAFLIILITSPYWVRMLCTKVFHVKGTGYLKTLKVLKAIHKPAALALLVIAAFHGYVALGALRLHTGPFAWLGFFVTAILGLLFFLKKKPKLLKAHRTAALVAILLVLVHLLFPNLWGFLA